jgi:riboflavin biosynthesis pyrimidine reductase
VIAAGETGVDGGRLARQLHDRGYRTVFAPTGPQIVRLLLTAGVVGRLYLTFAHRLLGGSPFSSIVEGDLLEPAFDVRLSELHLDPHALGGLGQLFAVYDCEPRRRPT